ncbi:MAG: ribosome small subunit-dependent GTPase A [Deltaproteobacteria bacterium]|nr:ribosome small subunit-dependent GTPase A [Deltaproteobacteria bacterium]
MTHTLFDLGLRPDVLDPLSLPEGIVPARVVADHGTRYHVLSQAGRTPAWLPPITRLAPDGPQRPAIGDWVLLNPAEDPPHITAILPRRTAMSRQGTGLVTHQQVIAANVDRVLVVVSMNKNMNMNRIERLMAAVEAGGAQPVLVIHKADLDPTGQRAALARLGPVADLAPVVFTSVVLDGGLDPLEPFLGRGITLALVGSSGVGKSTLVNHLLGREVQVTQSQRLDDDRGRHTTTTRSLFVLPDHRGVLIDTPGMRELALWSGDGIGAAFADVESLKERCRFRSCTHQGEEGCAVQDALDDGTLETRRWDNHKKLEREAEWMARRQSKTGQRQRGRAFSKMVRSLKKDSW